MVYRVIPGVWCRLGPQAAFADLTGVPLATALELIVGALALRHRLCRSYVRTCHAFSLLTIVWHAWVETFGGIAMFVALMSAVSALPG